MIRTTLFGITLLAGLAVPTLGQAQLSPAITHWLQNNTVLGTYYMQGNSTPISNNTLVNCQRVEYSAAAVYITCTGIPAYPTGPFLDGNPSIANNQNAIFRFPLAPTQNTGNPNPTPPGNIGVFINGVALFDYRDGVAWNTQSNALCGGPGNPPCPGGPGAAMDWNRDAIPAERAGFDCSKGHPAMGNYHHHQNPSAFKLDLNVVSNVCNLYDADGLYALDSTQHSPLIGYAYDGFPIYGAFGYANTNGTGGIARMKSGYQLGNSPDRTLWPDGTNVDDGPPFNGTYFRGYFREDYVFVPHPGQQDYLDEHNGRFCITPEYPNGTYAYFATVDENWNSAYPYIVGPTFYGTYANRKVTTITEPTTVYDNATAISEAEFNQMSLNIVPNPAADLVAIQIGGLVKENLTLELFDLSGKLIKSTQILSGQTIAYFDLQTVYEGIYLIRISNGEYAATEKLVVQKP